MDDAISRSSTLEHVQRLDHLATLPDGDFVVRLSEVDDAIINGLTAQPSAQPEIIRCKDCTHWSRESICDGFCSEYCMRHDEDFYCGYAERRTDG